MSSLQATLSEESLSESQQQLAVELAATRALQDVSTQMIRGDDIEILHERIMDAAVAIMRSDFASMQMFYPERGTGGELRLLAFRGFNPQTAKFWEWVRADSECSCSMALRTGKRVIVPDVENCDFMAGTEDQATYLQGGLLAVQSTPLVSRSGTLVGMISTHWKQPHQPAERELRLLDVLARQAADLMERKQAEEALHESEERYRVLYGALPVAAFVCDRNAVIQNYNRRAVELWGREPQVGVEQYCGSVKLWLPNGTLLSHAQSPMVEVLRTGTACRNVEVFIERPNGSRLPVIVNFCALKDAQGEIVGVVTSFDDITERKQAEEAVRQRTAQFETLLNQAPLGVYLVDADFRIREVNPVALPVFGDIRGGVVGRDFEEIIHILWEKKYADEVVQIFRHTLKTGEAFVAPERAEFRADRGITEYYEWRLDRIQLPDRRFGVVCYFRDISVQVKARATIAESEQRLRFMAESMPQKIFTATPGGDVDYFNPQWMEFTGLSFEQIRDWGWTQFIHPDDVAENVRVWRHSIATGEPFRFEHRFRRADGEYRWHISRALPLRDGDGRIVMWVGSNTDIDDQKRAAEERESLLDSERAARSEAERTGRMKDEFLATLSHELRTPLNAILGYATLMNMAKMGDSEVKEAARTIERNARVQAQLIEDLLDMNRIISGKVRLEMQRLNVPDVIEEAVKTVRPSAEAKGVRLELLLDTFAVPVRGDPGRIQQVVWNLLSNAVKFTPRGGKVQVLLERVNSHIEIIVTDTGAGIPPDFLPYVFDRFRQADGSTTRRHAGLGLGLAIVKHLVELHGGTIRASSPGESQGATFTISLPVLAVIRPDDTAEKQHPKAPQAPFHFDGCDVDLSGVRVLVVDDEPDATRLVKRVLEECKAEVAEATSAEAAYALLSKARFDVLVSDIGMPGEDGYQFIRKVRTMPDGNKGIPAIALTAFARSEDRRRAAMAGFQTHLSKPVEAPELLAIVANLAGKTGHASAEETSDA